MNSIITIKAINPKLTETDLINKKLIFIAKRCSGKSYLMKTLIDIMCKTVIFDLFIIISPTQKCAQFYNTNNGNADIYNKLDNDFLDTIPMICRNNKHVYYCDKSLVLYPKNHSLIYYKYQHFHYLYYKIVHIFELVK